MDLRLGFSCIGYCAAHFKNFASICDMIVASAGVAQGLEALRKGGVAPKLLIIDDGWQSTQLDEHLRPISDSGVVKSENKVTVQPENTCRTTLVVVPSPPVCIFIT